MVSPDYDYNFKLVFHAKWFDTRANQKKSFLLSFYPCDNTIELFDKDCNKIYLKRAIFEAVQWKDMFIGNTVTIYGRQIEITDYADCRTQKFIGKSKEHTLAVIKPSGMEKLGEIIDQIYKNKFLISRMRMCELSRKECLDFYESKKGDPFLPFIIEHVSSAPLVALELVGENAIERWKVLLGPKDPQEARKTDPTSFRALFGADLAANALHGADSYQEAVREACFFFPQGLARRPPKSTAKINNSTCCIIKPHAIDEGKFGMILHTINASNQFKITALQMFHLSNPNADEFLEIYKGVVSDFHALLLSYLEGPCVALEISGKSENMDVHQEFRKFCGPYDSDIARQIRPNTLRAMFGTDKYKNSVHCTDLSEDTQLEIEYFFKILDE